MNEKKMLKFFNKHSSFLPLPFSFCPTHTYSFPFIIRSEVFFLFVLLLQILLLSTFCTLLLSTFPFICSSKYVPGSAFICLDNMALPVHILRRQDWQARRPLMTTVMTRCLLSPGEVQDPGSVQVREGEQSPTEVL